MQNSHTSVVAFVLFLLFGGASYAQGTSFQDLDSDEDGKVSVSEFKKYAEGKLPGFDRLQQFAEAVDADGNGDVSESEFENRQSILRSVATSDGATKENTAEDKAAAQTFKRIKGLILDGKWEQAAGYMTSQSQDEVMVEQVISSMVMKNMRSMSIPVPGMEEAIEKVELALKKHKLDELNVDVSSMLHVQTNMNNEGDDKQEQGESAADANAQQKILKAVKDSGKRWEIVNELWAAKRASPFALSAITGEIENVDGDDKVVFLRITPTRSERDNGSGVMFQIMSPPVVYRMVQDNGDWKLDGRDRERTLAAADEFMKNLDQQKEAGDDQPSRADF